MAAQSQSGVHPAESDENYAQLFRAAADQMPGGRR